MTFYQDKQVIPCSVFEWGWETLQDNHFNPLSSWHNKQKIPNSDIGQTKIFLQFNRNAEINGEEFNQEEIDFAKIIIGKVINISTLENYSSVITKTFFNYHHLTPVYYIEVIDIFYFKEYLFGSEISKLNDFKIHNQSDFNFYQLNHSYDEYNVDAHLLDDDCIFIRTHLSEYSFQYYIVVKKLIDDKWAFLIKFFADFYCDTESYQLANYPLTQKEIKLLCANNFACLRFFM